MGVRVEGADRLIHKFQRAPALAKFAIVSELHDVGKDLKEKSQAVAPLDEGDLRDHAYSRPAEGGLGTEVGYEGLPYIIPQHEGGWRNHMGKNGPVEIQNYTTPGTQSKFLEAPWLENKERYIKAVKDAARRARHG